MRLLALILLNNLLLHSGVAHSQDITVRAEYPRVVSVGEQVRLAYTVNTSGGELVPPPFDGFYKLSGPNVSYSMSTQIINGRRTSETSYSYVFYLQATGEGKFTIPAARYIKDKMEHFSEPVEIEVIRDSGSSTAQPVQRPANEKGTTITGSDMYVSLILNKREVYVGEPVVATVKFYTRTDIAGLNEIKYPSFNGFLKEEIETPQPTALERENIDGVIFGTAVFQRFLLYPQRSGDIVIDPVQLTVLIRQRSGESDPFFGDFFQTFTNVPRMVSGQEQTIKVKPLPGSRPAGFSGAVGKFDMSVETDMDSLSVNEALTIRVTLKGQGNFRLADAPSVSFPAGLEVYDPKTTTSVVNTVAGTTGSRVFEYLVIPRSSGNYTIPSINWSYFDPTAEKYHTVSTQPVIFVVAKAPAGESVPQIFSPAAGEEIKYLGSDIRFIRTGTPALRNRGGLLLAGRGYYSAYGFSLLVFAFIIVLRREQVRRNSDRAGVLNRRAARLAGKRLDNALRYLKKGGSDQFFENILKALWGYVSDKTNLPVSELTASKSAEVLLARGAEEKTAREFLDIANTCELIRYSTATVTAKPSEIHGSAVRIIRELENQIR
ncbi:MAG: protein BatD [Bacteroidetes bacterium]|nr:protein BatD [Bacteroidota bacterium]